MYIGRFVILGKTSESRWFLGYRVSSRSFPNRSIRTLGDRAVVLPTADAPPTDNPYVSYNCLRWHGGTIVVANGSHVDPIIDKVRLGFGLRDAMALSLLALDYEHDQYNTPRIAAGLEMEAERGFLSIVAEDKLVVREVKVEPGQAFLIATYELTDPTPISLQGNEVDAICDSILHCEYEHPVAALAAMASPQGPKLASRTVA